MIPDYRSVQRNRNMVPSKPSTKQSSGGIGSLQTNRMVRDDDDHCPTVSTSVMSGNEDSRG